MKLRFLGLVAVLLFVPLFASAVTCAAPTVVPADGRVVDFDFVAANNSSNYYQFSASAGHSYSVEVRQDYDDINTFVSAIVANPGGVACPNYTAMSTGTGNDQTTDTHLTEPAVPKNANRVSFIAAAGGVYGIQVLNADPTNGHYISVSVSDTTLYNPRWSTGGGFVTSWGFENTTSAPITGTLTVTDVFGNPLHAPVTIAIAVPANGGEIFKTVGAGLDVNIPAGHAGYAVFVHNGPPGSVLVDAFFIGATSIVPTKFESTREKR